MRIPFWKMHGAANDFILADDRDGTFPVEDHEWIAQVCTRRTGTGSDGLILIQPSDKADFRMRFFNPDGSEVEMCGNGARCVARLAHEIGAAKECMAIDTVAGILRAEARGGDVLLHLTTPKDWVLNQTIEIGGQTRTYHAVNSGVPHVVIPVDDVEGTDVHALGAEVRYHEQFAPAGTNVNFFSQTGDNTLAVRTYERGVEAETCACGTGIVATGLIAGKLGLVKAPVRITAASGDDLHVGYTLTDDGATDVTLLGPTVHVFQGTLEYARK